MEQRGERPCASATPPPKWLATEQALSAFGCEDTAAGRRHWVERLDNRANTEIREKCGLPEPDADHDARRSDLRRGWYWGSQAFAERMLKLGDSVLRKTRHRSAKASSEKRAHGEQEARRLVAEGVAVAGLTEEDLKSLPGSEARKVAIARVVWEQTTVDMKWLAAQLHLRSAANASQQIRRNRQQLPLLQGHGSNIHSELLFEAKAACVIWLETFALG